jgi:hypothetical protein
MNSVQKNLFNNIYIQKGCKQFMIHFIYKRATAYITWSL